MSERRIPMPDGAQLRLADIGDGLPVLFQHGLGGDGRQAAEAFPPLPGLRRLTLEGRRHGASGDGTRRPYSFALFAEDLLRALDAAGVERFVAGGISMGAALALRLALRHPDRVIGLVLVRPAWSFAPAPANMAVYAEVAALMAAHPAEEGRRLFLASPAAQRLREGAPDNLASLLGFFDRPEAPAFATVMRDIAADGPGISRAEAAALGCPALAIGCGEDLVHPLALAHELAATIPGADFAEVTPKGADRARHLAELHAALTIFFQTRFLDRSDRP